jgi:uncharacterized protein (TIGR02001 family)
MNDFYLNHEESSKMKLINKLTPVALATAMAFGSLAAPLAAQAAVSSSATISSMYLWRGQDISSSAPVLSGDITYNHSSGAYASLWISSLGLGAGSNYSTESDYTIGFSGEAGPVGYDIGYYKFYYPENANDANFGAANAETYLGLTYGDAAFKGYFDAKGSNDYSYYTFSYGYGQFSGLVGISAAKAAGGVSASDLSYKHIDLTYAATDRLSFTYSTKFAIGSAIYDPASMSSDPLFMISYSLPIDLK